MNLGRPEALWLLLLLPLELFIAIVRIKGVVASVRRLAPVPAKEALARRRSAAALGGLAASLLFVAAAAFGLAEPSLGQRAERVERSGLEVALVLDVSRSMLATDLGDSRLGAAKSMLRLLFAERAGDAISLVLVKGEGRLLVPMTEDLEALDRALDWAEPGALSRAGTDLGSGLEVALASFSSLSGPGRLILLLSDGGDLGRSGREAALEARAKGVPILALGFGASIPVTVPGPDGQALPDPRGGLLRVALDSALLKSLASASGGRYFDAAESSTLPALLVELAKEGGTGTKTVLKSNDASSLFAFIGLLALTLRFGISLAASSARPRPAGPRKSGTVPEAG